QSTCDPWAAWIPAELASRILGSHSSEIGTKQRCDVFGERLGVRAIDSPDAPAPFACLLGWVTAQVIEADPGVSVDHSEWRRLSFQVLDDERQSCMFQHIAEVAGMIGVAVVHAGDRLKLPTPKVKDIATLAGALRAY